MHVLLQAALPPYSVTIKLNCGADFPPTDSLSEESAVVTIALATRTDNKPGVRGRRKETGGQLLLESRSRKNYKGYQPHWNEEFVLSLQENNAELSLKVV